MSTLSVTDTHLHLVMGTVVGFAVPGALDPRAVRRAVAVLDDADRIFSTWNPDSPIARLRSGRAVMEEFDDSDAAQIAEVLDRCALARELTGGAFDPWAMPGGVDPTGLVKGWAAARALRALAEGGPVTAMVNAGGDIACACAVDDPPWRVGIRHPGQPGAYAAIVDVTDAIATSGDYERPGQLIDPVSGRTARGVASATVTGPELDLADALATGLAVAGAPLLRSIAELPGYDALVITDGGRRCATAGMAFASP